MRHQRTDLPQSKHQRKAFKSRPPSHMCHTNEQQVPPFKRKFDPKQAHTSKDRCFKCGDSRLVEGFKCPAKKYQCRSCHKSGHFTSLHFQKQVPFKPRTPKAHQLQTEEVYMQNDSVCGQSEELPPAMNLFVYK